ncbi:hypothetical protein MKX03_005084 [Papaver bracteatum]|nr:hypothetical protein MKX03_005084 [Papaver bracteatum]
MPPPDTEDDFILTFDGYHRKKGKNGGYGALLRTRNGVPIAAVAGGSQRWISPYYHTLEGFLSGLDLVIAANVDSISCICNSYRLSEALSGCFIFNKEGRCRSHPDATFDVVCSICLKYRLSKDEPLDLICDIVRKIVIKGQRFYHTCGFMDCSGKEWNNPADFLAKLVRNPGEERVLTPEEFPEDLWNRLVINV